MGIGLDDVDLLKPGDFFLMRLLDPPPSNEGPTHARLIVGYGNPVEGIDDNDDGCPNTQNTICLLANQHTTDRYRVPAKYKLVNNPYLAGVWAWGMVW